VGHAIIAAYADSFSSSVCGCFFTYARTLLSNTFGFIHVQAPQSMQLSSTYKLPATLLECILLSGLLSRLFTFVVGDVDVTAFSSLDSAPVPGIDKLRKDRGNLGSLRVTKPAVLNNIEHSTTRKQAYDKRSISVHGQGQINWCPIQSYEVCEVNEL